MSPPKLTPAGKRLFRSTTLDELADRWKTKNLTGKAAGRWASLRAAIQQELPTGGELWDWESENFGPLTGTSGLAIVGDGVCTREWHVGPA